MTRTVLHGAAALVVAALLVGPSAQARVHLASSHHAASTRSSQLARTTQGRAVHDLMMGRNCGASIPLT
jgi:hypothetical protein